jgi:hypothetical protein
MELDPATRTGRQLNPTRLIPHRSDVRFQGAQTQFVLRRLTAVQLDDKVVQGRRRARWTSVDML